MQIIPFILATLLGLASLLPGVGQSPISENGYLWQCAPDETADCRY